MTNYKEILRLHSLGINNSQIAATLSCSRTTVISVLHKAKQSGIDPPKAKGLTSMEIAEALFPRQTARQVAYKMPDYEYVHHEMCKSGMNLQLLWFEYCEECSRNGEIPYQLTQFKKYYRDFVTTTKATMHIPRCPGEILEVDWAGQTAQIIGTDTGEIIPVYVFVAALSYSGYAYVEAFLKRDTESWITAHINMYNFFGGVTRILVPDNLKTGVEKVTKNETILNRTYQEMAEHYDTAVIPARVRSPKDKATVEGTVGIISTWIIAALRHQQFLSLKELNRAMRDKLQAFNHKPFQKKEGSRAKTFLEERTLLQPLPKRTFELATWKIATVQYNYHISVDTQNYSVPYEYIKQKIDVRATRNAIEIFSNGNRICSHPRLYGRPNQYATTPDHMPPDHQNYVQWNGDRFRSWAANIGGNTARVVDILLDSHRVEQQAYKGCMALLKLADKHSPKRLEAGCEKALSYTSRPSFKSISAILQSGQDKLDTPESAPHHGSEHGFVRGAEYYRGRNNQ